MGFLDGLQERLGDLVSSTASAVQAPFGLMMDLASSIPHPSEWIGTTFSATAARGAQALEGLMGPESAVGTTFDLIPAGSLPREIGADLNVGLQDAYSYTISRPVSTLMTVGSLASKDNALGDWGTFADPDAWSYAWKMSETRSPGQAVALAFQTKDILDPEEVGNAMHTGFYRNASGVVDGLLRWEFDPTKLIGEGIGVRRFLAEPGTVAAVAAPELAARALRYKVAGGAENIEKINGWLREGFFRLPESVQNIIGKDVFAPADLPRLMKNEIAKLEVGSAKLAGRDPAAAEAMLQKAEGIKAGLQPMLRLDTRRAELLLQQADRVEGSVASNATTRATKALNQSKLDEAARIRAEANAIPKATAADIVNEAHDRLGADITTLLTPPETRSWLANHLFGSAKWQKVQDHLNDLETAVPGQAADAVGQRAGAIRRGLFPTHGNGDTISWALAKAEGPAQREQVLRLFLGDLNALEPIRASNAALGSRLEDLLMEQSTIKANPDTILAAKGPDGQIGFGDTTVGSPLAVDVKNRTERLATIDEEFRQIAGERADIDRMTGSFGSLSGTDIRPLRDSARSFVVQDGPLSRAVRFFSPESGHYHAVDFADEASDALFARALRRAGMDVDTVDQWRGRYMGAGVDQRPELFHAALDDATAKILADHGLEENEIAHVLAHAAEGYRKARDIVLDQTPKFDGEGRAVIRVNEADGTSFELPLYATQLEKVGFAPDFTELAHAAEDYARLKYGEGWQKLVYDKSRPLVNAKDLGSGALSGIMNIWRPSVILRPAWTVRVMLMDEQLTQIAKFGVLATLLDKRREFSGLFTALREKHPGLRRYIGEDNVTSATRRGAVSGAVAGTLVGGPVGGVIGGGLAGKFLRGLAKVDDAGYRNGTLNGMEIAGPFGEAGSKAEVYRQMVSIGGGVPEYLGAYENTILNGFRRDRGKWTTYRWGQTPVEDAKYRASWARDVRQQIALDPMGRQFLEGRTIDEVEQWLTGTVEGRAHGDRIPARMRHPRKWVEAIADQIDAYTGGLPEVREGILKLGHRTSTAGYDKVLNLIPAEARVPIHGQQLEQILGTNSGVVGFVSGMVDKAFDVMGTMPHDELVANPTYARVYYAEMKRRLGPHPPETFNAKELETITEGARRAALGESRRMLDDLADRSRFEELTRNLIPFFTAGRQVVSRYSGLVADNPVFGAHAALGWSGVDKTGWVTTDDQGNEYINIRLPEFARTLIDQGIFKSALDDQGNVKLGKDSFNIATTGAPGFGPFAQAAVSAMAKQQPSLEESLAFVIPNGPVNWAEAFTPTTFQRYFAATGGEDNRSYAFARNRILITKLTDMQRGLTPMIDFNDPNAVSQLVGEVNDQTGQFMKLRMVAGMILPASPNFESPYQPYIDIYRRLRDGNYQKAIELSQQLDPAAAEKLAAAQADVTAGGGSVSEAADRLFLDSFGPEFFYLTQAFTKSNDGVPPTLEGMRAAAGVKDLIEKHPEWGSVIVGATGGGETVKFSRAAYNAQLENPLRPGSTVPERSMLSPEDIVHNPQVRLGWEKYSKISDSIENLRLQMGVSSLQGKQGEPLRQLKKALVLSLAAQSPAWFQDYSSRDESRWQRDIAALNDISSDTRLSGRQDMQGLAKYLAFRDQILGLLNARKSKSIIAQANADIANLWHVGVSSIVAANTAFADLYYRRLEHDPMSVDTLGGGVYARPPVPGDVLTARGAA